MSSLVSFQFLRIFPKFHPASLNIVRHRRSARQSGFVPNTLDPDKDFYLNDELEEEPVAYIDDSPDAALRPRKLTRGMERELQREALKKNIQKRKEFKSMNPKEPSLLTWAARNQIKHLHKMDPEQWDPDTLTRSFPVTKFVIKEILRSKLVPYDMAEIHKHDRVVYRNWLKLKEQAEAYQEGSPVDPGYRVLLEDESRRLMLVNAAGIADLPMPQERSMMQTQQDIAEQARPHVTPQFSSILGGHQGHHTGPDTVASSTDKGFIGLSDPEMMDVLEGLSKLKVDKENQMLSIKGGILEDSDSADIRQQFSPEEMEHEDETAMGDAHWLKNSHKKNVTNEEPKAKIRHWSGNPQTDSKPRKYRQEHERKGSQFNDGNLKSYTQEYRTHQNQRKPHRREENDVKSYNYGKMKDQGQQGENDRKSYRQDRPKQHHRFDTMNDHGQFDEGDRKSYRQDRPRHHHRSDTMNDHRQFDEGDRKSYRQDRPRHHHRSDTMNDHGQFDEGDRKSYRQDRPRQHNRSDTMNERGQFDEGDRKSYRQDRPRQHNRFDKMDERGQFDEGDRKSYRQDRPRQHNRSDTMDERGQFDEGDRKSYRQDRPRQHNRSDTMDERGQFDEGDRKSYRQDRSRQHNRSDTMNERGQFYEGDRKSYRQDRQKHHNRSNTMNDHRQFDEGDRKSYRQDRPRQHNRSDTMDDHRQFDEGERKSYRQDRPRQHNRSDTMNDHRQFDEGERKSYRQDRPRQHNRSDTMNDHRQFDEGDRSGYRQENKTHKLYQKPHKGESTDNARHHYKSGMKDHGPFSYKEEQRNPRYPDKRAYSKRQSARGEDGPHYLHQEKRHRNYRDYSGAMEDDFDRPRKLSGSLDDIYMLDKPGNNRGRKQ